MTATPLSGGRPGARLASPLLLGLVLGTLALAVVGGVLASGMIRDGDHAANGLAATPQGPFGMAQDIPVSFGIVAVEHVAKLKSTTGKDLGGMSHDISGLARPDQQQIQASVTLTNLTAKPVAYTPTQFRLFAGDKPITTIKSSFDPGELQPYAGIEGRLTFVVPRKGKKLTLKFRDPGRSAPVTIDLGRTARTPAGAPAGAGHHPAGKDTR